MAAVWFLSFTVFVIAAILSRTSFSFFSRSLSDQIGSASSLSSIASIFRRRAASFAKVVYYDQRGCGQSDYARGGGYTIDQAVADSRVLREALRLERWVVLGWSYGGVVAQAYLLKHPERVAGLVLVGAAPDAFGLSLQPGRQDEFISAEEQRKMQELHKDPALSGPRLTYNAWLNGDWKRQNYYKPTREQMARTALYDWNHDSLFRQSICRELDHIDFRGLFKGCPIPVLMAEGKHDLTWGADKAEKLSACFDGCQLVMFERSAHAPFADEPDKFFTALARSSKGCRINLWKPRVGRRRLPPGRRSGRSRRNTC